MKQQTNKNNYWNSPIIKDGLLVGISAVDWQTLTALAAYTDDQGECKPSLEDLCAALGLADISSLSKRLNKLEKKTFERSPVVAINRSKRQNKNGVWVYSNNEYKLHPTILTIFNIALARKNHQASESD